MITAIIIALSGFFVLVAIAAGYGFFFNALLGNMAHGFLFFGGAVVAIFCAVFTVVYGPSTFNTELEDDPDQGCRSDSHSEP